MKIFIKIILFLSASAIQAQEAPQLQNNMFKINPLGVIKLFDF
jgi:hypothetical protein